MLGETGTGKELLTHALHARSTRAMIRLHRSRGRSLLTPSSPKFADTTHVHDLELSASSSLANNEGLLTWAYRLQVQESLKRRRPSVDLEPAFRAKEKFNNSDPGARPGSFEIVRGVGSQRELGEVCWAA
ncbi:MAG: hypothetical protein V3R91_10310 [Myxococcota bacterium]